MSFLWTGYVLTWLAVAGYAWRLERRREDEERNLRFLRNEADEHPGVGPDRAG